MNHPGCDTGMLRSYMDGEVEAGQSAQVADHMEACGQCRAEVSAMKNNAENVTNSLDELPETRWDAEKTDAAWTAFRRKMRQEPEPQARVFTPWRILSLAGAGTAVAFVTLLITVAPLRSWAENLLSIFRVEHFTVLEVNPSQMHGSLQNDAFFNQTIGHIFSDDVKVIQAPQRPVAVSDGTAASKMAGFQVRLLGGETPSTLLFRNGIAAQMRLNRDRLQSILDEAGHGDLRIPESADGAVVSLSLPAGIMAFYGNCGEMPARMQGAQTTGDNKQTDASCMSLMELRSPVVTAPPQVDPAQIAQIALQFMGMNASDAANFTQTVDWTTTLVLPVVQGQTSYEKVFVAGNDAVLLRPKTAGSDGKFTLLWVENGVVYALAGTGDDTTAVNLAEQLE